MRYVMASYTQAFNRRHRLTGHLSQNRLGAIHCTRWCSASRWRSASWT